MKEKLTAINRKLSDCDEADKSIDRFIAVAKTYADFDTLTPEIIVSFVEKIFVHQMFVDENGDKCQQVELIFNYIGAFEHGNIA